MCWFVLLVVVKNPVADEDVYRGLSTNSTSLGNVQGMCVYLPAAKTGVVIWMVEVKSVLGENAGN